MRKVYSQKERIFIKENYPENGASWVAKKLGLKASQIKAFAKNNKLTRLSRNRV